MVIPQLSKVSKTLLLVTLPPLATVVVALIWGQTPTGPEYVNATSLVLDYRPTAQVDHPIHTDLLGGAIVSLRVRAESGPCTSQPGAPVLARWGLPNQAPMNLQNIGVVGRCERLPIQLGFGDGVWEVRFLPPSDGCFEQVSVGLHAPIPELHCDTKLSGEQIGAAVFKKPSDLHVAYRFEHTIQPFEQRIVTNAAQVTMVLMAPLRYNKNAYQTCMANAGAKVVLRSHSWKFLELETRSEERLARLKAVSRSDKAVPTFEVCTRNDCSETENACRFNAGAVVSAILGKLFSGK